MTDLNESNEMEGGSEIAAGEVLEIKANRVIAFLSQIAECLEKTEMTDMNEILLGIFEESKKDDSSETRESLMQLYSRFFEIVEFRSGISVKLINQALRSFKMIAMEAMGLGNLVSTKYTEMILLEYPSLGIDMQLTPELLRVYFRLLKAGSEEVCHVRLMVVGMYGVGKSTLVRRLCNKGIHDVTSTEGIDILTDSCEINDDGDWEISKKDQRDRFFQERLQVLVNKYGERKKTGTGDSSTFHTKENEAEPIPSSSHLEAYDYEEEKSFAKQVIQKNREHFNKGIVSGLIKAEKENELPKRKPTVSIWDFAGQSVYYSTHHFFLNDRSIYLVVLNLSKQLTDEIEEEDCMGLHQNLMIRKNNDCRTCHDAFKFWMRSIYIYTQQRKGKSTYKPKIILIGTHKDKITKKILRGKSLDQYKEDYFMEALDCFRGRPVLKLVHEKKFLVANKDENEDFLEIKKEIYKIAIESSIWREKIPASFILLEQAIQEIKGRKEQVMDFGSLQKANEDSDLPRQTVEEIELFLKFQTAFGNVLHYNHDRLRKIIILNPQWIIDIFKIFVTHKQDKVPTDSEKWTHFQSFGKLCNSLIDELLEGKDLSAAKEDVVKYMEYFNVMVRPVEVSNGDRPLDSMSQEKEEMHFFQRFNPNMEASANFYIMPCMLPIRPTDDELKELFTDPGAEHPPTLCMYIKKGFLPPFVFHCIIATCLKELPVSVRGEQQLLFNCLAEFQLGNTTKFLFWFVDDFLNFTVIFKHQKEKDKKQRVECCKDVRKCFENLVLSVFNIHGKDTFDDSNKFDLFEYLVECPWCSQQVPFLRNIRSTQSMNGLLRVINMETTDSMCCSNCRKSVTKQKALGYWFDIEHRQEDHSAPSPTEEMLADFAEIISTDEIDDLRCELLITDAEYSHIRGDFKGCQKTIIFHVLYCWMLKMENVHTLRIAMEHSGCSLEDFDRIVKREETEQTLKITEKCMEELDEIRFDTDNEKWNIVVNDLVKLVGRDYWLLGIRLHIRETELQQNIGEDPPKQIKDILNRWWRKHKSLKDLIKAMVKSKCKMIDVKEALKEAYSS